MSNHHKKNIGLKKQSGVVLIVSLVLLLVLTLLALAATRNTLMQTKMSANLADRDRALQAAEFSLVQAEEALKTVVRKSDIGQQGLKTNLFSGNGIYDVNSTYIANPPFQATTWGDSNSADAGPVQMGQNNMNLSQNPRYMLGIYPKNDVTANLLGADEALGLNSSNQRIEISALGWGAQANTHVKIQTEYFIQIPGISGN